MRIRIQLAGGPAVARRRGKNRHVAAAVAALLNPAALLAGIVGAWGISSDLDLAGPFGISEGLFSHWQTWIALAGTLLGCGFLLNRYAARHASPDMSPSPSSVLAARSREKSR